jgi:hypothetical protein
MCGELAFATIAALLRTLPADLLDKRDIGIASEKSHQVNITLVRPVQNIQSGRINETVEECRELLKAID